MALQADRISVIVAFGQERDGVRREKKGRKNTNGSGRDNAIVVMVCVDRMAVFVTTLYITN